jgi:hypothetical protein
MHTCCAHDAMDYSLQILIVDAIDFLLNIVDHSSY